MQRPIVTVKSGRARLVRAGHPWLFSGALEDIPEVEPGTLCELQGAKGAFLATAYVHPKCGLAARILALEPIEDVTAFVRKRIAHAVELRRRAFSDETNAYRVVASEGDGLPGVIVDRYADVLVLQILTAGMELLRDDVVAALVAEVQPRTIFERSDVPARREEGLPMRRGLTWGDELASEIEIRENGLRFVVQPDAGQKTGFYLDQRDNRARVRTASNGRSVLNCFSYTGGFSVAAAAGGATRITSLDSSAPGLELLRLNMQRNGFDPGEVLEGDAFDGLRALGKESRRFDVVVLDPPAFAKKRHQFESARRGYKEINLQAFQLLQPGGELFTFSCSQHFDVATFRRTVTDAAADAGVRAQVIGTLGAGLDHPVAVAHLEGEYLKGLHLRLL